MNQVGNEARPDGSRRRTRVRGRICAGLALLSWSGSAWALQGGEDPATLPVLLERRHGGAGTTQISLLGTTSLSAKYTKATGAGLLAQYNLSDVLGVELAGAYLFGGETGILNAVRAQAGEPAFSDLYRLQWYGAVNLVFVPLYGKISFASEWDPAFEVFLVGGAGFAGSRRQMGLEPKTYVSASGPMGSLGLGLKLYLTDLIAFRIDLRDYFYSDPGAQDTGDPKTSVGGITWNLRLGAGLQMTFGGES